jgi:hypothetical protein
LDQHTLVLVGFERLVFCMEWQTYVIIPFPEHQWMQNSKNLFKLFKFKVSSSTTLNLNLKLLNKNINAKAILKFKIIPEIISSKSSWWS